jgi:hypothetical protein
MANLCPECSEISYDPEYHARWLLGRHPNIPFLRFDVPGAIYRTQHNGVDGGQFEILDDIAVFPSPRSRWNFWRAFIGGKWTLTTQVRSECFFDDVPEWGVYNKSKSFRNLEGVAYRYPFTDQGIFSGFLHKTETRYPSERTDGGYGATSIFYQREYYGDESELPRVYGSDSCGGYIAFRAYPTRYWLPIFDPNFPFPFIGGFPPMGPPGFGFPSGPLGGGGVGGGGGPPPPPPPTGAVFAAMFRRLQRRRRRIEDKK